MVDDNFLYHIRDRLPLPDGRTLFDHQIEDIQRCWQEGSCAFIWEMGLGKTLGSLIAAAGWGCRIICVVKPSLVKQWQRESAAIEVDAEVYSWTRMDTIDTRDDDYVIIFDESQLYCNLSAKRTKKMLLLSAGAECVIHLTGTPMPEGRPKNLYPLLLSLEHELARDRKAFELRYCAAKRKSFLSRQKRKGARAVDVRGQVMYEVSYWDDKGARYLDELAQKISNKFFVRRKRDCLDLPDFTRVMREVELSEDARTIYDHTFAVAKRSYLQRLAAGEIQEGGEIVELGMLRRAASAAKCEEAISLGEEILQAQNKVVLFTLFRDSAQRIASELGCECLHGGVSLDRRQAMIDRLDRDEAQALVATLHTGGEGLNLQSCNYAVLVDRWYTPGSAAQVESRIDRQGQRRNTTAIWLQLGELDERIDEAVISGQIRIDKVLNGERKTMRGIHTAAEVQREVARALFER